MVSFLGWGQSEFPWCDGIWSIVKATDDDDKCGAVGGMSGKENLNNRKKPAPVPICPPQIPCDLSWA
jgi:hypothetical protein